MAVQLFSTWLARVSVRLSAHGQSGRAKVHVALQSLCSGNIGIVDHDTVELSNLHRQILHTEARVGWLKVDSAKAAMLRFVQIHSPLQDPSLSR